MHPNSALAAWQLAVMAVVAVTALGVWLTAVFVAAREPRPDHAAATASATTAQSTAAPLAPVWPTEPEPADRKAA
jgi:cytoskeletal protein RodZ